MGLKKYILGSVLLILAVFAYTFSIESGDYRIELMDQGFVLPVAVWIVAPVFFLFLMSVFLNYPPIQGKHRMTRSSYILCLS